jgi:Dynamin family.
VDTLKAQSNELKEKIKRWQQKSQKLSIGIIGQVKAGKSSFLNALLFDGKPILPEAATPKTANLTKISYGEQFLLSIDYYTKNEWEAIKEQAQLASDSTEVKIAKELVEMAGHLSEHERQRCLENGREEIRKADLNGLQAILNQYTGNNGSHTPLVKSTQIQLPFDDLKGFEVVDTPGMNDPVASRTNKTREYMANCDVVFFLSRCSQFLDKSDDDLLKNHLPNKGVKRLVVVAGQFDSAILDDGYDRSSLQETINNLTTRQTRQALQKSEQMVASKVSLSPSQANMVQESLSQPIFSSSFAYGFANWPQSRWSKSMKHMYKELTEMANEEWGRF